MTLQTDVRTAGGTDGGITISPLFLRKRGDKNNNNNLPKPLNE